MINLSKNQLIECKRVSWSSFGSGALKELGEKFSQPSKLSFALRNRYQSPPAGSGGGLIGYIEINDATSTLTRQQIIIRIKQYLNQANVPESIKDGVNRMDEIIIMRSNNYNPISEFAPILKSEWQ